MVMAVIVVVTARAQALPEDRRADEDDEQPRDEREPGVELLRDDERGQAERHESEREDSGRVRDRDRPAEHERVPRRSLRSDEVRSDHRLPVTRSESVRGAPERRDQEREKNDAQGEVTLLDERLETAVAVARTSTASIVGAVARLDPELDRRALADETSRGERRRSDG